MKLKKIICLTLSLLMMSACFAALPAMAADTTPPETVDHTVTAIHGNNNMTVTENVEKDGVSTTMIAPINKTNSSGFDCGTVIDLNTYNFIVIEMYFEKISDNMSVYPKMQIVQGKNKTDDTTVTTIGKYYYPMTQLSDYDASDLKNRQGLVNGTWVTYVFPLEQTHSLGAYDFKTNNVNYITYWKLWFDFNGAGGATENDYNAYIKSIKYTANAPYDISFEAAQNGSEASATNDFRFIASVKDVNLANYSKVGFDITRGSDGAKLNKNGTAVYSSILANGAEIKAESYGGKYIVALELNGVPTGTDDTLLVTPYLKDKKGNKISGKTAKVTIVNGSVTECSWEVK